MKKILLCISLCMGVFLLSNVFAQEVNLSPSKEAVAVQAAKKLDAMIVNGQTTQIILIQKLGELYNKTKSKPIKALLQSVVSHMNRDIGETCLDTVSDSGFTDAEKVFIKEISESCTTLEALDLSSTSPACFTKMGRTFSEGQYYKGSGLIINLGGDNRNRMIALVTKKIITNNNAYRKQRKCLLKEGDSNYSCYDEIYDNGPVDFSKLNELGITQVLGYPMKNFEHDFLILGGYDNQSCQSIGDMTILPGIIRDALGSTGSKQQIIDRLVVDLGNMQSNNRSLINPKQLITIGNFATDLVFSQPRCSGYVGVVGYGQDGLDYSFFYVSNQKDTIKKTSGNIIAHTLMIEDYSKLCLQPQETNGVRSNTCSSDKIMNKELFKSWFDGTVRNEYLTSQFNRFKSILPKDCN